MRSVGVVVVMDDVVGGDWTSKIRRLSALWNELCSLQDEVILGNKTNTTLTKRNLLCVPHMFGELFCKRHHKRSFVGLARGMVFLSNYTYSSC